MAEERRKSAHVSVCVRLRPLAGDEPCAWVWDGNSIERYQEKGSRGAGSRHSKDFKFNFEWLFAPDTQNLEVYNRVAAVS